MIVYDVGSFYYQLHWLWYINILFATYNTCNPILEVSTVLYCMVCFINSLLLHKFKFMHSNFRKSIYKGIPNFIHFNLALSLFIGLIVFVSGIETAKDNKVISCYFLVTVSWLIFSFS